MKRLISSIFILSFLLISASCTREDDSLPSQASSAYEQIVRIYRTGLTFREGNIDAQGASLSFNGGGSVKVPASDFTVDNCMFKDPATVSVDNGVWLLNGHGTGIRYDSSRTLEESFPVYGYFTRYLLCIYASNGESMLFFPDETDPLVSFSIKKRNNPQLERDINFKIDGTDVTAYLSLQDESNVFIPTFIINADYVTVEGERQVSSSTPQDFSSEIIYSVHKHSGEVVDYKVSVQKLKSLPSVYIETDNHLPVSRTDYIHGTAIFKDPFHLYSDVDGIECPLQIKGRGNSSWNVSDKKPYRIKLDEKQEIMGLHEDRDFVLLANYSDKSLLRNHVAMELSRICEMRWTPAMLSVDVTLNGKYRGVYDLSEQREVNGHKVDIELVTPEDNSGVAVTGGYYLEIESKQDGIVNFYTSKGIPIIFNDPEDPTQAQIDYVKNYLADFEAALYSPDFADPEKGYAAFIDVDSFINYFIIAELSKNIDGTLAKSTFMTKERNGKLAISNVWDFDLAFGNCNYISESFPGATNSPEGWLVRDYVITDYLKGPSDGWYGRMFKDPAFTSRLKQRWNALKPKLDSIPEYIDLCVEGLYGSQDRNFETFPILNVTVWPNCAVFGTYELEVAYLKSFYTQRLKWMDEAVNAL